MSREHAAILLIEDNPGDERLIREMLVEGRGVVRSLEWVDSLEAGRRRIALGGIDLVLLDLGLPGSTGLETLRQLRANATQLPVVVMSGLGDEAIAVQAVMEGAQDYLVKGQVDGSVLIRSIRYAIERNEAALALRRAHDELEQRVAERTTELRQEVAERQMAQERLQENSVMLEEEIEKSQKLNDELEQRVMLAELSAEIGCDLAAPGNLQNMLKQCSESLVRHLNVAFARIWTFNDAENVLELQASAGLYTRIDGSHSRVPVGKFKIGLIAEERKPHITNAVLGDPRVHDQEWAKREGMVAFAGHPLIIGDKLVGVMAMFSRNQLSDVTLKALESVSNELAIGIERKRNEEALEQLNEELEQRVSARTSDLNKRGMEISESQQALMNIVEDLNQKTEELEQANAKLMELERLKSMFIASMSHELRTPLNSIIGFSSILLNEWVGQINTEQKENLAIILRCGKHLLNLINDVIDVSKIETGKIESVSEEFDLHDLLSEAVSLVSRDMDEKGLDLHVVATHQQMQMDRRRLLQCLLNLLSNALKFTEKGSVTVEGRIVQSPGEQSEAGVAEITVTDTGIGIREEDLPKMCQPFVRLASPLQTIAPGTGLGLYLSRKLAAEVLKGDILFTSEYGKGSQFTIRIPVRTP